MLLMGMPCPAAEKMLSDKEQINAILKERKDRFEGYTNSLQETSGFFGGKSKKDLKTSQKILVEIVRLDNRLISILNRQIDYKTFEKTTLTYQSLDEFEKQDQLKGELATKRKEIALLTKAQHNLVTALRWRTAVMVGAILVAILVMTFYYKNQRKMIV